MTRSNRTAGSTNADYPHLTSIYFPECTVSRRSLSVLCVFACLTAIGVAGRLISRELTLWNFTPVAAIGLFAGYYFERAGWAAAVSLTAMSVSNLVIGGYGSNGVMFTVYGALLFPIVLRSVLRTRLTAVRVLGTATLSSVVFFVTTNFAHFYFTSPDHSWNALVETYAAAIPFFDKTLLGDLCFSGLLFGGYAWATRPTALPATAA